MSLKFNGFTLTYQITSRTKMADYKLLTVNEDDGHSDRMSAVFTAKAHWPFPIHKVKFSVSNTREFIITSSPGDRNYDAIKFHDIDLDGLIQYLQDVKVFLHEEDMMKKLIGK